MSGLEIFAVVLSGLAFLAIVGLLIGLSRKGARTAAWKETDGRPDDELLDAMDLQGSPPPEDEPSDTASLAQRWHTDSDDEPREHKA